MSGVDFLDTNVVLYAWDPAAPDKQRIARDLLRRALDGGAVVSIQVLAEFASALLHKKKPPAAPDQLQAALEAMRPIRTIAPDNSPIQRAVEARAAHGIHFYDALIVASAERAACSRIFPRI